MLTIERHSEDVIQHLDPLIYSGVTTKVYRVFGIVVYRISSVYTNTISSDKTGRAAGFNTQR